MKIIKRDGREVPFDYRKIKSAIEAANADVAEAVWYINRRIEQIRRGNME